MDRKIVMDTGCLHLLHSDEAIFKMLKEAGFSSFDYTLFWKGETEHIGVGENFRENALKVKQLADKYALKCEQTHAYFTAGADKDAIAKRVEYISKDIESTAILGAKLTVVHPIWELSAEENIKWIKENFLPLAHKFDVKLAIENVWGTKDNKIIPMCTSTPMEFVNFIDAFNDEYIVACLDIGHAEMKQCGTTAVDMINALGPRLKALHIHDNDTYWDAHEIPYTQAINFSKILDALKKIKYEGNITFEVESCYSKGSDPTASLPFELYPAFIKLQLEIGKYFKSYLEREEK